MALTLTQESELLVPEHAAGADWSTWTSWAADQIGAGLIQKLGRKAQTAVIWYAAHHRQERDMASDGNLPSVLGGTLTTIREGDITVSMKAPAAGRSADAPFNSTRYGRAYVAILTGAGCRGFLDWAK